MSDRKRWVRVLMVAVGLVSLTGCSSKFLDSPNKMDEHSLSAFGQNALNRRGEQTGKWESAGDSGKESVFQLGGEDGIFGGRGRGKGSKDEVRADKLFAGALAVVMELPITVANREGGIVTTDWKVDPEKSQVRYRLNIRVSGKEPYGEVQVAVLKQELVGNQWQDRQTDSQMADQIERAIRKRAQDQRP